MCKQLIDAFKNIRRKRMPTCRLICATRPSRSPRNWKLECLDIVCTLFSALIELSFNLRNRVDNIPYSKLNISNETQVFTLIQENLWNFSFVL